jgi:hypothetical protein
MKTLFLFLIGGLFCHADEISVVPGIPENTKFKTKSDFIISSGLDQGFFSEVFSVEQGIDLQLYLFIRAKEVSSKNRLIPKGTTLIINGKQSSEPIMVGNKEKKLCLLYIKDSEIDCFSWYGRKVTKTAVYKELYIAYRYKSVFSHIETTTQELNNLDKNVLESGLKNYFEIEYPEPEIIK